MRMLRTTLSVPYHRKGFLHLDPEQIASICDTHDHPLIYVAQEMKEPMYGWPAIHHSMAALPEHLEKVLSKEIEDLKIDVLGDTAIAFFISHSRVKLKVCAELREPRFWVNLIFPAVPGRLARDPFSGIRSLRAGCASDDVGMNATNRLG